MSELQGLQSRIDDIRALDAELLAISIDTPEQSAQVVSNYDLDYRLLCDPERTVVDLFGVRHSAGGPGGDIARPATFILDRDGRIVWRDLTDNWRIRVRPEPVLEQLAALR